MVSKSDAQIIRGLFGKFVSWHHTLIKCYQIIHFWKPKINGYLMVYFFFEKDLACMRCKCSNLVEVHTLAEILSKTFGRKEGKL